MGVALGVLMTQILLRSGPPICEWNRQDLAKKTEWDSDYVGQEGDTRKQMVNEVENTISIFLSFFCCRSNSN